MELGDDDRASQAPTNTVLGRLVEEGLEHPYRVGIPRTSFVDGDDEVLARAGNSDHDVPSQRVVSDGVVQEVAQDRDHGRDRQHEAVVLLRALHQLDLDISGVRTRQELADDVAQDGVQRGHPVPVPGGASSVVAFGPGNRELEQLVDHVA